MIQTTVKFTLEELMDMDKKNETFFRETQQNVIKEFADYCDSYYKNPGAPGKVPIDISGITCEKVTCPNSDRYFVMIKNPARNQRPGGNGAKPQVDKSMLLINNILEKGQVIFPNNLDNGTGFDLERYDVAANQFPILKYHSVMFSKEHRRQGELNSQDLTDMMEYSYMTDQFVIYNHQNAGGTIDHMHFQGFNREVPLSDSQTATIPIVNLIENYIKANPLQEEFTLHNLVGLNKCFRGKFAPEKSIAYINKLKNSKRDIYVGNGLERLNETPFNLEMYKDTIAVIPRADARNTTETGGMWAGLEMALGIVSTNGKDLKWQEYENAIRKATFDKTYRF